MNSFLDIVANVYVALHGIPLFVALAATFAMLLIRCLPNSLLIAHPIRARVGLIVAFFFVLFGCGNLFFADGIGTLGIVLNHGKVEDVSVREMYIAITIDDWTQRGNQLIAHDGSGREIRGTLPDVADGQADVSVIPTAVVIRSSWFYVRHAGKGVLMVKWSSVFYLLIYMWIGLSALRGLPHKDPSSDTGAAETAEVAKVVSDTIIDIIDHTKL